MQKSILKALSWDFFGSIVGHGSALVTTAILSRILNPTDFGLAILALAFLYILNIVQEMGFRSALIQQKSLDQLTTSSVFYLNLAIGVLLFVLTNAFAPNIALFYDSPQIEPLLQWISVVFIINAFSTVQIAMLSRDLDFRSISIRLVVAKIVGGMVGIGLALYGWGPLALIIQELVFALVNTILLWRFSSWRPSFVFAWQPIKSLFNFGVYLFFGAVLDQMIQRLDELMIGKVYTADRLGYYGQSKNLSNMINGLSYKSLSNVLFPVLSQVQDDNERFASITLRIIGILTIFSFFLSGLLYFVSKPLVLGFFGDQWEVSVFIFQVLLIRLFTYPISNFLISALLAKGFSKENFVHGLLRKGLRLSTYLFIIYGTFNGFLFASVGVSIVGLLLNILLISPYLGIERGKCYNTILLNGLITLVASLPVFYLTAEMPALSRALICSIVYTVIFIGLQFLLNKRVVQDIKTIAKNNIPGLGLK